MLDVATAAGFAILKTHRALDFETEASEKTEDAADEWWVEFVHAKRPTGATTR